METKRCGVCGKEKPLTAFGASWGGRRKNVCHACTSARWSAKLKLELLEAFGCRCSCCSEAHPHFLTLDHLVGTGHYKRLKTREQIYSEAKRNSYDRTKYRLLCMNCNFAIGHYGTCPHQGGLVAAEVLDDLRQRSQGTGRSLVRVGGRFEPGYDPRRNSERKAPSLEELADSLIASGITSEQLAKLLTK